MMIKTTIRTPTPGGNQSTPTPKRDGARRSDSGEPAFSCFQPLLISDKQHSKRKRKITYLATININSLLQVGKLKQTLEVFDKYKIKIAALQETRFTDEDAIESKGYRIYKGKPGERVMKNVPHLGTGFAVHHTMVDNVLEFTSPNGRTSSLSFRSCNRAYTIVNFHAPTNDSNRKDLETVEHFWDTLEETLDEIPSHHSTILMGDFNAQVGKERKYRGIVGYYPAHKRTNRNGERLIELCDKYNLVLKSTAFKHLPRKAKTWRSPNPLLGEFQIDHVAMDRRYHWEVQNVKVLRGANIDSDHYLSLVKTNLQPLRRTTKPLMSAKIPRFNTMRLHDENCDFQSTLKKNTQKEGWPALQKAILDAAHETIPASSNKGKHPWWTTECDLAIEERRRAWLRWNQRKIESNHEAFLQQRKTTASTIRTAKRNYLRTLMQQAEENFQRTNSRDLYKGLKRQTAPYAAPTLLLRGPDGKLQMNNKDCTKILAEYFQKLLNTEEPKERLIFRDPSTKHPDSLPPTREELEDIIKGLKNNKASGEDGIVAEMWKHADEQSVQCIHQIIQEIWRTETLPEGWTSAVIHPLHKKGSKTDLNNYRGISLLQVTYKIFSAALLTRVTNQLDPQLGEYQAGFRTDRSCPEQIQNLKTILAYKSRSGHPWVAVLVDFEKAYDSVDRDSLFSTLREFGLDEKTVRLVQATLKDTTSKVKFRGELSESFPIRTGVRQGDGISCILFNCILEKIIREWMATLPSGAGLKLGYKKDNLNVPCLAFADDLTLLANNIEEASYYLQSLYSVAIKTGLKISIQKTEFMTNIRDAPSVIPLEDTTIKRVSAVKYLGEWISANQSENLAINTRCTKFERAYHSCKSIYSSKSLSKNLKLRHYNSVVKPSVLYASECLVMARKGLLRKLEIKERKILRRILGPVREQEGTYRIRHNYELYEHQEDILTCVRKRRLAFYGHLTRMSSSRLTNRIFTVAGRGKASKNKWIASVKSDLEQLEIPLETTQDRLQFRHTVRQGIFPVSLTCTKKTGTKWTVERKLAHSQIMKEHWKKRKEKALAKSRYEPRGPK